MLRKLICLILIGLLCLPACAEQEAPSHLYHFTSAAEAPAEIADSIADLFGSDVTYIDGYATMRFGHWTSGQIILQDAQGYILCGLTGIDDGSAWQIEYSRTALRQDEAPVLYPEAVKFHYDDEAVSQSDGCDSFDIIYGGLTYRWHTGSNGWILWSISASDYCLGISSTTISLETSSDDSESFYTSPPTVYNLHSNALSDFDISVFPTTWENAKAISDASEYNDQTQALTVLDAQTKQEYLDLMADTTGVALIDVYLSPDNTHIASMFESVAVEIIDQTLSGDWCQIRVHDFTGWVRRENLLIGTERAPQAWREGGDVGCVYSPSRNTDQPIYATANHNEPTAFLPASSPVTVLLIDNAGRYLIREGWTLLQDELGGYAWMDPDTVCMTDNYHDAHIYSYDASRRLNLRTGPGSQYESIGKYYSGVRVVLMHQTDAKKGWRRVIIEGVSGWVMTDYLAMYNDYNGKEWLPPLGKVQGVNSKGLNLRTAPNKNADIIAAYPVGTSVEILGIYDSIWAHVRLQDGNSGYMMLQFLGGEPEKAASNSFKLTRDITTTDGYGDALCEIKKGTYIRVTERPVDGQKHQPWISIEEGYGYIPPDCANFW
ncbi:MAG: SH3 domain-containing protein [Clostridia bacterium]|nr:SH3 domain-containing protein [Clostridia bacterium]